MRPEGPNRRLAAILSADVVGYSRLMAEDEAATVRTLTAYRKEIQGLVADHRGRVVDATGDNLLAEFPTALGAVECAVEIQRVIGARNAGLSEDHRMAFRIGVHLGDVRVEDDRLYGDGMIIAARLEGLADPGGICISATIHEQVERKLGLAFEDLGEKKLHNIPRPIHVFRIGLTAPIPPAPGDLTVPGFLGRPAVAVLPFDNLSGNPEQEYFADGIAEDLITRLSSWRRFPVIARNSSFTYKGQAVDVQQVGRDLGARYVVEGSVRRAGDRVRVSAQLIDAMNGRNVWAETYDRDLHDIFALQDDITLGIVASMGHALDRAEVERVRRRPPDDLDAWDTSLQAQWRVGRSKQDNAKARELYARAAELDPDLAGAWAGIAFTHVMDFLLNWSSSPRESLSGGLRAAQRAVAVDPQSATAQLGLGWMLGLSTGGDTAIDALELAVGLDPSSATARGALGIFLARGGRGEEALESFQSAMRLSPRDPMMWFFQAGMGVAHFAAGEYEEAVKWSRRSLQRRPFKVAYRTLAASYAHLGRIDEARAALQEGDPSLTPAAARAFVASASPSYRQRYLEGLRKAGLEE